jgi:hypothetical protein
MNSMLDQIEQLDFHKLSKEKLSEDFKKVSEILYFYLLENERVLLNEDFDFYLNKKGRFYVHNTFAGGIIFLREPETIEEIRIEFYSDKKEAFASVEYASELRNSRNVKYKPNAGKVEKQKWNMSGIFPHFNKYRKNIKLVLIVIIGKIVKHICEYYNTESWFMKFKEEFQLNLFLDGNKEIEYEVGIK